MAIQNNAQSRHKHLLLRAEQILKYLITGDDTLETLVFCGSSQVHLVITDQGLYEALGSIQAYDAFNKNKLTKLLETCQIRSFQRKLLTPERVEQIRKFALAKGDSPNISGINNPKNKEQSREKNNQDKK